MRFFRLTRASRSLSRFAGGNRFAVIRFFPGLDHHRLGGIGFFLANARQCGVDRILIFPGRLNGGLLMAFLTGDFFALQSRLTRFETCLGFRGAFFFHGNGINLGLLLTEVLHQRNVAWADPGAGAAFNAVGQVMGFCLVVQLAFAVPVQLLREQIRRAGIGTGAAADATFLFLFFTHFGWGRGEQTVRDFHYRNVQPRQRKAHQRAAHDHHLVAGRAKFSLFQQMAHRRTQTRPDVARTGNRLAGQRHHALGQRLAVNHRAFHRIGGADVLHQHADIRRASAVRDLLAGENLRQLFCAARRVLGRDNAQANIVTARQHGAQHRDGLRFIVFDTNQHFPRLQNVRQDADAFHHLSGAILHQTIVGGDIRLALGGVDNQRLDVIATAAQLDAGREARAAQPGDAELMNTLDKRFAALAAVIAPAVTFNPAVFAVGFNDHAQLRQRGRMSHRMRGNRYHFTGGGGVHRQHTSTAKGQRLTAKNRIAFFHAQLALSANMLLERHDVTRRQRNLTQRRAVGLGFHLWRMNTAVKVPNLLFSESRK